VEAEVRVYGETAVARANRGRMNVLRVWVKHPEGWRVQLYQELSNKPTLFVPKPVVLLALADHYSGSDPTQAARLYKQVKDEFPDTQAAQQADERLQVLQAKG